MYNIYFVIPRVFRMSLKQTLVEVFFSKITRRIALEICTFIEGIFVHCQIFLAMHKIPQVRAPECQICQWSRSGFNVKGEDKVA